MAPGGPVDIAEEDAHRAHFYALLGNLLREPPRREFLETLGAIEGETETGREQRSGRRAWMAPGGPVDIAEEDAHRAHLYALLGNLLREPPRREFLETLGAIEGETETELGRALKTLGAAARKTSLDQAADEYQLLFIGLTRGELVPYASYYLTGFLHEKPLARLRGDMGRLGIARADGIKEPEDHIAAICEMMAGMITGAFGAPIELSRQQDFFGAHLASWAPTLFKDLEAAKAAALYMPVGTIGRLFMAVESQAFEMAA